jgi:hypothetical protein
MSENIDPAIAKLSLGFMSRPLEIRMTRTLAIVRVSSRSDGLQAVPGANGDAPIDPALPAEQVASLVALSKKKPSGSLSCASTDHW